MTQQPHSHADLTVSFLRDSDARCPVCRYALRGAESGVCPECGYNLELAIATPAAGPAWWMMSIIGLAVSSAILFLIIAPQMTKVVGLVDSRGADLRAMVRRGFAPPSELPDWPRVLVGMVMMLACLALISVIIGCRRQIITWPAKLQIPLALVLLFLPVLMLSAIALWV